MADDTTTASDASLSGTPVMFNDVEVGIEKDGMIEFHAPTAPMDQVAIYRSHFYGKAGLPPPPVQSAA